jgi:peptidyl-prolyl cis-trans isomerase B (cyclophilin B)
VRGYPHQRGRHHLCLFGREAPITVGNFIELARASFYDGTSFHKAERSYLAVGGDPNTRGLSLIELRNASVTPVPTHNIGLGNPGYFIRDEWQSNPLNQHKSGCISMVRGTSPNTAGCQFFFVLSDIPGYDRRCTVFGKAYDRGSLLLMQNVNVGTKVYGIAILPEQKLEELLRQNPAQ